MRSTLLSCLAWLGALQSWRGPFVSVDDTARRIGMASVLGTLTVLVYRLGVWRQQMEHTKDSVGAEMKAHREESAVYLERIDRRLEAIDHLLAALTEQLARMARRHARTERRVQGLEEAEWAQ